MGNLVKLGTAVINKDKIISAEIYDCNYPINVDYQKEQDESEKLGFLSGLLEILTPNSSTQLEYHSCPILIVDYEIGNGRDKITLYNNEELHGVYSTIVDTYNENHGEVYLYSSGPVALDTEHRPSEYAFACCNFINKVGGLTYTEEKLEDILNSLV